MRTLALALAVSCAVAATAPGCIHKRATYATVTIVAAAGTVIPGITVIRSTVTNEGDTDVATFDVPSGSIDLGAPGMSSETYTLDLRHRTGLVDITVEALNAAGIVVGMGFAQTSVAPEANWMVPLTLAPTGMDGMDGGTDSAPGFDSNVPNLCGNGALDPGEECDDGDTDDTDFCAGCSINEIPAATPATLAAAEPRVAMRDSGEVLVLWTDVSGADHDVYARRFDADGLPIDAAETRLNMNQPPNDEKPDVALDPATGDFVAVWHSCATTPATGCNVFARLFAWDLTPQLNAGGSADELMVNLADGDEHVRPSVALTASGFVVVWQSAMGGVVGRLFDPTGAPAMDPFGVGTDPFPVPEFADVASCSPHVASASDNRFVVVWGTACAGFDATSVSGRLFPNGAAPGSEFAAPTACPGPYRTPTVAMATDSMPVGAFLVVWEAEAGGDSRVEAAGYAGSGAELAFIDITGPTDPGIDRRDPMTGYNPGDGATGLYLVGWRETSGTGGLTSLGVHARLVQPSGSTVDTTFPIEPALVAAGDAPSPRVLDLAGSTNGTWAGAWRTPSGVSFRLYPAGFRP
jgi:hypothetical protein